MLKMKKKFSLFFGFKNLDTNHTYKYIVDFLEDEKEAKSWVDWFVTVFKKAKGENERN